MPELSAADIEQMLERAAEKGAKKAMHNVGLHDENAFRDVADLRSLLNTYRTVRMSMLKTAANMLTAFVLGALALGTGLKFWNNGGG